MVKIIKRTIAGLLLVSVVAILEASPERKNPRPNVAPFRARFGGSHRYSQTRSSPARYRRRHAGRKRKGRSRRECAKARRHDRRAAQAARSGRRHKDYQLPAYAQLRYPREGGQPRISGYSASNIIQVKTSDLTQVGEIIDTAYTVGRK